MRRFDALRADEPPALLELDFETFDNADDLARGMVGDGVWSVLRDVSTEKRVGYQLRWCVSDQRVRVRGIGCVAARG